MSLSKNGGKRIGKPTEELVTAANNAFLHLAGDIERLLGVPAFANPTAMARTMAVWSLVHGFASLLNSGHMRAWSSPKVAVNSTWLG